MPIYKARGGEGFRVTHYAGGKNHERICRGTREDANKLEKELESLFRGIFPGDPRHAWPSSPGVYVIQVGPLGEMDPIKIGVSDNVRTRLDSMQTGLPWPIRLLFVLDGDRDREGVFHRRFSKDRMMGEWFRPGVELRKWVADQRARWIARRLAT